MLPKSEHPVLRISQQWLNELKDNFYLITCGFFVFFLIILGVVRFYRSIANRIRQYQLEYLKHFEILNEDLFNRLLKPKRKSTVMNNNNNNTYLNRSFIAREDLANNNDGFSENWTVALSEDTNDSSITILSLRSSSLDDFKSIIDGKQVKSRIMYDLESIVRDSVSVPAKKKTKAPVARKRCKNPRCKKLHGQRERESVRNSQETLPSRRRRRHHHRRQKIKLDKVLDQAIYNSEQKEDKSNLDLECMVQVELVDDEIETSNKRKQDNTIN